MTDTKVEETKQQLAEKKALSRRDIMRGGAMGAFGLGAMALANCSPSTTTTGTDAGIIDAVDAGATVCPTVDAGTQVTCAEGPPGYMCRTDWLGQAPTVGAGDIIETAEYDVVVLGGGHAGTQAALALAQAGKKVAVVESQPLDTYTWKGDDICSYNSSYLTARGFGGYDTGEIVAECMRRAAGRVSPQLVSLFVQNSGEMFDNLVTITNEAGSDLFKKLRGDAGVSDTDFQCMVQVAYNKPTSASYPISSGGYKNWATTLQTVGTSNPNPVNGRDGVSRLTEIELYCMNKAVSLGARWYNEYSATSLVQDSSGAVTGCVVKRADGKYAKLSAKTGVLLATGDFGANADMVWELVTEIGEYALRNGQTRASVKSGMSKCDGIGQKLGCWAGGVMQPAPRATMGDVVADSRGPWGMAPFLCLNNDGKRFMDEAQFLPSVIQTLHQPLGLITTIIDSNYMQTLQLSSIDHGAPNWGWPKAMEVMDAQIKAIAPGTSGKVMETFVIQKAAVLAGASFADATLYCESTIEALGGKLGYTGTALQNFVASVAAYNAMCDTGKDTQFGKDAALMQPIKTGPFYGAVNKNTGAVSAGLVTLAGLMTNDSMQVVKADHHTPIPGLYAAGNCLGQRFGLGYITPSAGYSMGSALTTGRVAGKLLAAL